MNRYDMLGRSCSKTLPVWKRLVLKQFEILNIELDIDEVIHDEDEEFCGRMCRLCASALQRLETLESSTQQIISDAIGIIVNENCW